MNSIIIRYQGQPVEYVDYVLDGEPGDQEILYKDPRTGTLRVLQTWQGAFTPEEQLEIELGLAPNELALY